MDANIGRHVIFGLLTALIYSIDGIHGSQDGTEVEVIMNVELPEQYRNTFPLLEKEKKSSNKGRVFIPEDNDAGEPLSEKDFQRGAQLTEDDIISPDGPDYAITRSGHFEGDITIIERKGRNAIKDKRSIWTGGMIPYMISKNFTEKDRSIIARAIEEYHNKTCIRFRPKKEEKDYVYLMRRNGCSSYVGKRGGAQPISLGLGCVYVGIVIHELMHAVGFWHEQSRADRDDYVTIIWENIRPGLEGNFAKYSLQEIQHLGEEYDYGSVMHYGSMAFTKKPGFPTIVPKKSGVQLGQRNGFSKTDLRKINKLYNCDEKYFKLLN